MKDRKEYMRKYYHAHKQRPKQLPIANSLLTSLSGEQHSFFVTQKEKLNIRIGTKDDKSMYDIT